MQTRSNKFMSVFQIGDYVTLPIPDVYRGLTDPPNLICRIVDIDYNRSLHEHVCEAGVLNNMLARNCFDLVIVDTEFNLDFNLSKSLSVREAVDALSIGGGKGMVVLQLHVQITVAVTEIMDYCVQS